jgi:predicted lipoprotein with Yx(FWY)xxD motif
MLKRWCVAGLLAAALVAVTACGSSSPSSSSAATKPAGSGSSTTATVTIKKLKSSLGTVLETSKGQAVYWFAPDTSTTSKCYGSCATYWPPVIGKAQAAAGVTLMGTFGTIKRKNGQLQATYDGHPLYTYAGDSAAGDVTGNDVNASGGLWWAMTPSGKKLMSSSPKTSPSPASTGYSY